MKNKIFFFMVQNLPLSLYRDVNRIKKKIKYIFDPFSQKTNLNTNQFFQTQKRFKKFH